MRKEKQFYIHQFKGLHLRETGCFVIVWTRVCPVFEKEISTSYTLDRVSNGKVCVFTVFFYESHFFFDILFYYDVPFERKALA
jgi:hypothetical protein